jgi:hypothetical protein
LEEGEGTEEGRKQFQIMTAGAEGTGEMKAKEKRELRRKRITTREVTGEKKRQEEETLNDGLTIANTKARSPA